MFLRSCFLTWDSFSAFFQNNRENGYSALHEEVQNILFLVNFSGRLLQAVTTRLLQADHKRVDYYRHRGGL